MKPAPAERLWATPTTICRESQKVRFECEAAAIAGAVARVNRTGHSRPLAVYECPHCGGWHHTSSVGGANRGAVARKRRKAGWTQEKLDRAVALVRDAEHVALVALFEYPKGDVAGVLRIVGEAMAEARELEALLARDDLESPELAAAVEALRPKLRTLEALARLGE